MKVGRTVLMFVAVAGAAYLAGNAVGNFVSTKQRSQFILDHAKRSAAIARSRFHLRIGDTLPDQMFETLTGDTVLLSQISLHPVYLVAVLPTCESCLEDMSLIAQAQAGTNSTGPFVFVTSGNPRLLLDVKDSLQLRNEFLYDHKGQFLSQFDIDVYPTMLVIGQDRRIQDIEVGDLLPEEIRGIIAESTHK